MIQDYFAYAGVALGALIALTNVVVEVIKKVIPNEKFPTNLVAVIVALVFTVVGFFGFCAWKEIAVQWYYVCGAIVAGVLVAYGAMFGYDKLKEILEKFKT